MDSDRQGRPREETVAILGWPCRSKDSFKALMRFRREGVKDIKVWLEVSPSSRDESRAETRAYTAAVDGVRSE